MPRARSAGARIVLLVEDDALLRSALARSLRARGYDVLPAATSEEAIAFARRAGPRLAILDLRIGDTSGVDILCELREIVPSLRAVLMSGYGSIAAAVDAMRAGAVNFLSKPVSVDELLMVLQADDPPRPRTWAAPSAARAEWEHISRVLNDCHGNISEAARRMGMHRRSLQRKLAKQPPAR